MKAYLINLDRSPDRLAQMRKEFDRVGVPLTRFAGVDTLSWGPGDVQAYFRDHPSFSPTERLPGDAGAFLSHFGVWQTIAASSDDIAAVFEDDVHLAMDLRVLLSRTDWIPADADIVRLESNSRMVLKAGRRVELAPTRKLYRAISGTWGAAGYVITKAAAARLVGTSPDQHTHIDWFLFKPTRSLIAAHLIRYQIVPAVCIQDDYLNGANARMQSIVSHGIRSVSPPKRRHPVSELLSKLLPRQKRPVPFVP
jgi:glycosyl transferase, family 25